MVPQAPLLSRVRPEARGQRSGITAESQLNLRSKELKFVCALTPVIHVWVCVCVCEILCISIWRLNIPDLRGGEGGFWSLHFLFIVPVMTISNKSYRNIQTKLNPGVLNRCSFSCGERKPLFFFFFFPSAIWAFISLHPWNVLGCFLFLPAGLGTFNHSAHLPSFSQSNLELACHEKWY